MSFWQPRSVLQLVFVGFFAVLAPFVMAILFTVQTLDELTSNSRRFSQLVVEVTRLGQSVQGNLLELERRAGQYFALADPDPELAALFERERDLLSRDLQTLQQRLPSESPDVEGLLNSLQRLILTTAEGAVSVGGGSSPAERLKQSFELIDEQGAAVQTWLQASLDRLMKQNTREADDLIGQLELQLGLLASATLALLLFFAYWINRPVKDLTQEIHALGTEGLSHSIEISGPQEVRELGDKLEWLRRQLQESEAQKQQFLRHMSHELKTPLSSLREGADLLSEQVAGHLSRQQEEIVEIVRENGIELQRLIENLIDYNQLPRQELDLENFSLEELVEELLGHYRISLDNNALTLELQGMVDNWEADRYKLRTALDNLLSNAVNYTPEGGRIEVVWRRDDANLVVEVANSGEPIPDEDAERVFEPFVQSSAKRTGPIKGSGIGLSVARECMEVQGGSLSLIDHPELPVCFRIICPAHSQS
jgi:two-component system sensor histidine kinase GlrK